MGFRLPNLQLLHAELEVNLIAVSYRGYGDSEGHPSEHGLQLDAEAVLQHALKHPRINKDKLFLFGRSLGGAVALHLAAKASDDVSWLSSHLFRNCIGLFTISLIDSRDYCREFIYFNR